MDPIERWIPLLHLEPHPEGGYFAETYRAADTVSRDTPSGPRPRSLGTAIYYLLRAGDRSRLHRLGTDEIWHHYDGGALTLHLLHEGEYESRVLGRDADRGEAPQVVVPAGRWFGATVEEQGALVGCTLAPGFEYEDFELGTRAEMLKRFPRHRDLVERLTDPD